MKELILKRIERIFNSYEDKKDITYIVISKKLYNTLGRPNMVCHLLPKVDNRLYKNSYFFAKDEEYEIPPQVHSIEYREVSTVALKVTRVVKSLEDRVQYNTEIAKGTTMNELGFLLANVIKEMNDANYCKTEDMLDIIQKYLKEE